MPDKRSGRYLYGLKITNYEVLLMFEDMVESWFPEESSSYENFKQALLLGDLDYMNQYMNQWPYRHSAVSMLEKSRQSIQSRSGFIMDLCWD